ncbi:MAG: CoA transferase [Thalassospira sp.]|uniref:CaiB/BaiF CoA transferase family protein n=1 Tax=Thalassospira sp. GB04J01 TaxID=1485225 RepID=UPI000C0CC09D|nr:CaiB/BaiF CoA-transferase family protein [Thalassospira sp. GB04J01]MBV16508.1 CoA transferase [Thalassospira sp.]|tara:strand:+ start:38164 stop:39387 length:1224 start_codon:yes stop_codon:yes gene_type:complete
MTGALSGIRVLDLSRVLAGPWASQTLADLGAEVIKIERPGSGDDTRGWGPPFAKDKAGNDTTEAAYYLTANRGKKSLTVDITKPEGQKIVRNLAAQSDVVLENFKVGGLAKYGLDYTSLAKINPKLVYCSITGFGQDGPYKDRPGYDFMIQGMGGLMSITGAPDEAPGGQPMKVGVAVADIFTGLYATIGILAALRHRDATGEGQYIDLALLDVQTAVLANQAMNYLTTGKAPERLGNAHPNIVPYEAFPSADGYLILAVGNDSQFKSFCEVAGLNDLPADARYATNRSRVANRETLVPMIRRAMVTKTTDEWIAVLEKANVPCGPINTLDRVFDNPQVQHRGMIRYLDHPVAGKVPTVANPIKFSKTPISGETAAPMLGQHSDEILRKVADLSDEQIEKLRSAGII